MDGVKDEKCYDYGGSPIFRGGWGRGGGHKKTIYLGNCLKGGGGGLDNLQGLGKK